MWERMAQLKLAPDLAAISRHRMCEGDQEEERKAMFENVLPAMERAGWNVKLAFVRFWEGERDLEKLLQGIHESNDRTLVKHVYEKYFKPLINRKMGGVEEEQVLPHELRLRVEPLHEEGISVVGRHPVATQLRAVRLWITNSPCP